MDLNFSDLKISDLNFSDLNILDLNFSDLNNVRLVDYPNSTEVDDAFEFDWKWLAREASHPSGELMRISTFGIKCQRDDG